MLAAPNDSSGAAEPRGPMRPLHLVNTLRLEHVLARIESHFGRRRGAALAGLRIFDVGGGGGLLAEPAQALRPQESFGVGSAAGRAGLQQIDRHGIRSLALLHRAAWCRDTRVNDLASFARAAEGGQRR